VTIAVLGTGMVGRTLAARLAELGHPVSLGTRDPAATAARDVDKHTSWDDWLAEHAGVTLVSFADAAAAAPELVIHAANGASAVEVLHAAAWENLAGKVVLDVSNPLDASTGFPPALFVENTDSLAERIQAAFPDARVVKSLNTMNANLMAHPETLAGGAHTVFVSGNDPEAKAVVGALLRELGHTDIIDLGALDTARGPEMYLPLWLRLFGALGHFDFNIRVVRGAE